MTVERHAKRDTRGRQIISKKLPLPRQGCISIHHQTSLVFLCYLIRGLSFAGNAGPDICSWFMFRHARKVLMVAIHHVPVIILKLKYFSGAFDVSHAFSRSNCFEMLPSSAWSRFGGVVGLAVSVGMIGGRNAFRHLRCAHL